METYESKNKSKIIASVVTIIVIIGIVIVIEAVQAQGKANTAATTTATSTSTPSTSSSDTSSGSTSTSTPTTSTSSSTYKDGSYTATADYYVPHGEEEIKVTLTVASGIVTDSSIVNSESDHDSVAYQENFASAYKTYVMGKSISDLKLSYVSGASDTTDGFNDALAQIRTQATS